MTTWNFVVASVIGTSHERTNKPCQDFALCEILNDSNGTPVLVAVGSDGAGSADYSEVGSRMACEGLFGEIKAHLGDGSVQAIDQAKAEAWLSTVASRITEVATQENRKPRDYACTILAAIVGVDHATYFQIGDGAIVVSQGGDSDWSWIFWPQKGEFANTTTFITDENAISSMEFSSGSSVKEVALFTDGIEKLVLDFATKSVFHPFFDKMFVAVRASQAAGLDSTLSNSLAAYLASPPVCERTDDDKSLIMATRKIAA